ncbi:MAG: TonB-dependent receptor plug domain-containing protein, partial [Gemmatimonadetes bacterium]|nr:TonB-dependent receptor plug domain-containing protein [Gemmatimonadota bacterium]
MSDKAMRLSIVFLAILLAIEASPIHAQTTGTITGTVADAESGELLDGVQIHIPTLGIGVLSRDGGRFTLEGVPAGTHELRAELIGHLDVVRTVTVTSGGTVSLELEMEHSVLHVDELVVTGTAFSESPVELPYAVSVMGRRTLAEQGAPQSFDLFRNVTASSGILGARQGWYTTRPPGLVTETAASVNLRGIGASRTLVLLNGRRQVQFPMRISGGRFVDVNAFPSVAVD